jgi:hypothetical protein
MEPTEFKVPKAWPRCWSLDIDRANASVLWAACDRESNTLWLYSELVMPRHELSLIANAIKKRSTGYPGLFDHLARKRSEQEGFRIIQALQDLHLDVFTVRCDPDAGAAEVAGMIATKRLKVLSSCTQWLAQYRSYRRNKDGEIVEESDGLMRATDLLALEASAIAAMSDEAVADAKEEWGAATRDRVTGY